MKITMPMFAMIMKATKMILLLFYYSAITIATLTSTPLPIRGNNNVWLVTSTLTALIIALSLLFLLFVLVCLACVDTRVTVFGFILCILHRI